MHSDITVAYGLAVRALRQSKEISQENLADLCGLHRTYISDVELGKRNVSLENIQKIASALGVSLPEMFVEVERHESI